MYAARMRPDIDIALKALDAKGQSTLTGLRVPGKTKKGLEQLASFLDSERVLALAAATDLPLTMGEQRNVGAAASLGAIADLARSARLLVLTDTNVYEVHGGGRLKGNQAQGVRIPLADITDVRGRSERSAGHLLAKQRVLMIDYMRGIQLETMVCEVAADSQLEMFTRLATEQLTTLGEADAHRNTSSSVATTSVADELAKLAQLRENGILTDEEFAQQKVKLLGD
jgi:hypothetical protein